MTVSPPPQISVIMSVYNGAEFLGAAIESVLNQTFRDFEFIIVDDGSIDETGVIIRSFEDERIKIIRNDRSIGQTRSLNMALAAASGRYVARMDADDICKPKRLEVQRGVLERNPDVVITGSSVMRMSRNGRSLGHWRVPISDFDIRFTSLITPPFIHPAVMFRREAIEAAGGYDETLTMAQDYELWTRLLQRGHGRNVKSCLLYYRQHEAAGTRQRRATQLKLHEVGMKAAQASILPGWTCSGTDIHVLRKFLVDKVPEEPLTRQDWLRCMGLLFQMINIFFKTYPTAKIDAYTARSIIRVMGRACFRHGDTWAICATAWQLLKFRWYSPFVLLGDLISSTSYRMRRRLYSRT